MEGMKLMSLITQAEARPGYQLRLRYKDGVTGVVDMAPTVAKGGVFLALAGARFGTVRITQRGRALSWIDDYGEEVDFDADALRMLLLAEQAAAE